MKRESALSTYDFHGLFPDEATAVAWYEAVRWTEGRHCPHCDSTNTATCAKPQPYRCRDCRKHFSVKTGTVMQSSKLPVKKWLYAMYLMSVSKKGLSSCQLARELGIAQEAAWRLGHKIREAWNQDAVFPMQGTVEVEVDETFVAGKGKNKHADKRHHAGRGGVGKAPVMGIRSRASEVRIFPVARMDAPTLHGHIRKHAEPGTQVYTDGYASYRGMRKYRQESVAHDADEYVRGQVHINGIESFWSLLKRGHILIQEVKYGGTGNPTHSRTF